MIAPTLLLLSALATTEGSPSEGPTARQEAALTDADVAPLFAKGSLARAKAAFDAGRLDEAADLFARAKEPEGRYLRALALLEAGRGAEAVKVLAGLAEALPAIADRVHHAEGRALEAAGRRRDAAAAFARVPQRSLVWADARLAAARNLDAAGDAAAALEALAPALTLPPPEDPSRPDPAAEALLLAGRLRLRQGGDDAAAGARRHLVECWAGHPLAPVARECRQRLDALPPEAGGPPSDEDQLRRAEWLLDRNRTEAALSPLEALAEKLPGPGPAEPLSCRARFALGRAYRKQRMYAKAVEELGPVAERCGDAGVKARARFLLAGAAANARLPDAVDHYEVLAREYPDSPLADDALYYAADQLVRDGQLDAARARLAAIADRYPNADFRADALFRLGWLARSVGDVEGALAAFSRLEDDYREDPYEHARASYWRARVLFARAGAGDADAAREVWARLAARSPADYYGLLSRARLAEIDPTLAMVEAPLSGVEAPAGFRYVAGPLLDDGHFRAGVALLRAGLARAAAEELGAVDRRLVTRAATGAAAEDALLLLADLLDRAGDPKSAHNLVRTLGRSALRRAPQGQSLRVWRIAYPPAFRAEVEMHAGPSGVPVELLQALMREESGLDPRALSPAGAVGLTQLMVPTAREVARRAKVRPPTRADLMQPSLNVRLGARYLGELVRKFDGSVPLALASYNAGDSAVRSWLRQRCDLTLDEFVEEIPLQETRGYVKRVLRSYSAYRLLYGRGGDALALGQKLPGAP
jgi:soluble lytic murein transglycosylase